jgi:hypothetical protein
MLGCCFCTGQVVEVVVVAQHKMLELTFIVQNKILLVSSYCRGLDVFNLCYFMYNHLNFLCIMKDKIFDHTLTVPDKMVDLIVKADEMFDL